MMNSKLLLLVILDLTKKLKKSKFSSHRQALQVKLSKLYSLYILLQEKEADMHQRKCWVRPIFSAKRRMLQGASNNIVKEMIAEDHGNYTNFFRMSPNLFRVLLDLVAPAITKQQVIRDPISAETRLELTIRYLASGDSMKSISYAFRVGPNTVSKIISETCDAIWDCLKDQVFLKDDEESWQDIAQRFEEQWNFPNCIGAIDGKHITLQAPPNSGSVYYNYKGHHSINLLAISDADYCFSIVDIGAAGRRSDGGIFHDSVIGERFRDNTLHLPQPRRLEANEPPLPYVLVADEAFPLLTYILRPYPRNNHLDVRKKVFNYRLSRARRVVESAFGILVARWRIYRKPIIASVSNAIKMVKATIALHNFIMKNQQRLSLPAVYENISREDEVLISTGLTNLSRYRGRSNQNALATRDAFSSFFQGSGALPYQWERALANKF